MDPTSKVGRFATAVDVAPCGALLVDTDGIVRHTNRRLDALFAYPPGELVGGSIDVLLPPEHRAAHPTQRAAYMRRPTERPMGGGRDLFGVSRTGRRIPVEVSLHPMEDGLVLCTVVDITERLRREEHYRLALDAAPNAILMTDEAGHIVLCNRHAEAMFGHPPGELLGRSIECLLPASAAEAHRRHRSAYMADPTPRAMGSGRELTAVRADGATFPVEVALQPVASDAGRFVIAAVLDISARAEAWQRIEHQQAELNDEIQALARGASHDLKGPLSTIVGLAGSMLEDLQSGDLQGVSRVAQWTRDLATRTAASLEKLRELADTVVAEHPTTRVNLRACVEETLTLLEPHRAAAGIEVRMSVEDGVCVQTERPRLVAILQNLLTNAFQYFDPDLTTRWVEVTMREVGPTLHLTVKDNGIGIPPTMRERVFDLFERAHQPSTSGSGIGLALVRRHVRHLGGSIRLEPSEVTTFVVELPTGKPT